MTAIVIGQVKHLYRYRGFGKPGTDYDEAFVKPIFVNNELYFPTRTQLNDPFECIVPAFTKATTEYWKAKVGNSRRRRRGSSTEKMSRKSASGSPETA